MDGYKSVCFERIDIFSFRIQLKICIKQSCSIYHTNIRTNNPILECFSGTFGLRCIFNCSQNCLNATNCNSVNGSCDGECIPGWTGDFCNIGKKLTLIETKDNTPTLPTKKNKKYMNNKLFMIFVFIL